MSAIGERIRRAMDHNGISFAALSGLTGISKATLQRYASGATEKIPAERLYKIAAALGIAPGELLGESDSLALIALDNGLFGAYDLAQAAGAPTGEEARKVSDHELMFALFGDAADISDADLEDVKRYAAFVVERKKRET